MKSGKNGIGFITRFDTEEFKVKVAAEVKDFDPTLYLEKKEIRKTDLYTQYALAAAAQAVEDSGIIGTVEPERLGVYVGSGIGGMTTFVENCKKLFDGGPKKVSPFFIPSMIANIAAGTIAIKHNAQGPSMLRGNRLRHQHTYHRRGVPRNPLRLRRRHDRRRRGGHHE